MLRPTGSTVTVSSRCCPATSLVHRLRRTQPKSSHHSSRLKGFTKSLAMTVLTEIGDKIFSCNCGRSGCSAVVVVDMKMDSRSKQLPTWVLVKGAQPGDPFIAFHILDPIADKSTLLSLVKNFESVLAAYKCFCNLIQELDKLTMERMRLQERGINQPKKHQLSQGCESCRNNVDWGPQGGFSLSLCCYSEESSGRPF